MGYTTDSSNTQWVYHCGYFWGSGSGGSSRTVTVDLDKGESVYTKTYIHAESGSYSAENTGTYVEQIDTGEVTVSITGPEDQTISTSHLEDGETVTKSLSQLPPGEYQIDFSTGGADTLAYEVSYTEQWGIDSPVVKHDGTTYYSEDGILTEPMNCTIPNGTLEAGRDTLYLGMADGESKYTVDYHARSGVKDVTVTINGETYSYPEDFDANGALDGTVDRNTSALTLGENGISAEVLTSRENVPQLSATIQYNGSRVKSLDPEVIVIKGNRTVHSKEIPDSDLGNEKLGQTITLELPRSWFTDGENQVIVKTADDSFVQAHLQGSGLKFQADRFEQDYQANATG